MAKAKTAKKAVASHPTTNTNPTSSSMPSRRNSLREQAASKRRNQNLMIGAAAAIMVLVIGAIIFQQIRKAQPVAGEASFATQGNVHIPFGDTSPIPYNSVPPTSGPHYDNLVAWGIHADPQRYEHLNHNLEDGGVIVYYQCPAGCAETVDELKAIVQPFITAGRHVVLAPNDPTWSSGGNQPLHEDMGALISVNAWQRQLKLDAVDAEKIRSFIERYVGIDHHVPGIG